MVTITEKLYEALVIKIGEKKDKKTNEHTLQGYIAICLIADSLKQNETLTISMIAKKINKKERRTEDIVKDLIELGLVKKVSKGYEVIG